MGMFLQNVLQWNSWWVCFTKHTTVVLLMGVFYKTYYSGTSGAPDGCFTGHTLMGVFYNMYYSGTPDRCVLQYVLQWN